MSVAKVAFVVGASSGIGYAVATELSKRGYKVYAGARRVELLEPLQKLGIKTLKIDSTNVESIKAARDQIAEENGNKLDLLHYNAGIMVSGALFDLTDSAIQRQFDVNVFGVMKTVREFHRLVVNARGLIAITGSTAGLLPLPAMGVYAATKAAIASYAETLAIESKPFGVTVLNIIAGAVDTPIGELTKIPKDSLYYDEDYTEFPISASSKMDVNVFAKKVVNDFEKALRSSSNYWTPFRGAGASLVWFTTLVFPRSWTAKIVVKALHFDGRFAELEKKYAAPKKVV